MAGFWDWLNDRSPIPVSWFTPRVTVINGGLRELLADEVRGVTPAALYRSQPNLRTIVTFLARNFAQCRPHVFEVAADGSRNRDRTSDVAQLLARPNPTMTGFQLFFALRADKALHDVAYWWVVRDVEAPAGFYIWRLPPSWVEPIPENAFSVGKYRVANGTRTIDIPKDEVVRFGGYSPVDPRLGSSAVDALRDVLAEQIAATKYRRAIWDRGGKVSAVLTRPADAPEWSAEDKKRFQEDWYASFTGDGPRVGGTPLLEDGMKIEKVDFSATDQQWLEGVKLGFATVAQAFHVQPSMVGQTEGVSWATVREFRKMLYGETLGPDFAEFEDAINAFLIPIVDPGSSRFVEFNVGEKLQADFETQAQVETSAAGAPWMLRNEIRARHNLPPVEGGDSLVVPLNVLVGGQASPRDSGSQNVGGSAAAPGRPGVKAAPVPDGVRLLKDRERESWASKYAEVLRGHLSRQREVVQSRLGAKAGPSWWDADRWDRELADDLTALNVGAAAAAAAGALDGTDHTYDEAQTVEYLKVKAAAQASAFNAHTLAAIEEALDDDEDDDPVAAAGGAFDALEERSGVSAETFATGVAAWGVSEAGRQTGAGYKTWLVTSSNPRPSHAELDGETVPMDDLFSNGLKWPGDGEAGDVDEVAGCTCQLVLGWES